MSLLTYKDIYCAEAVPSSRSKGKTTYILSLTAEMSGRSTPFITFMFIFDPHNEKKDEIEEKRKTMFSVRSIPYVYHWDEWDLFS